MDGDRVTQGPKPPLDARAKRRRTRLVWGFTVLAATIGILLIAAVGPILFGQNKTPQAVTSISPRQQSETLRTEAQAALAAGETTAALSMARSAVAADPSNAAARDLATRLTKSSAQSAGSSGSAGTTKPTKKPTTKTPSSPSGSTAPADVGYIQPVADFKALLPAALAGFAFESPVITPGSVSISASPEKPAAGSGRLIWTVRDTKSVKSADDFVRKTTKALYGKQGADVTVHGVTAYYGTDGERIATVTYARGRYVFELLLPAEMGSATGTKAAEAFRDTPLQ